MTNWKVYGGKGPWIILMYTDDIESEYPRNTGRKNLPLKKSCSKKTTISLRITYLLTATN